jgi:glucan phosphorylase
LIFKDIERIADILNDKMRPVQIIIAGKPSKDMKMERG